MRSKHYSIYMALYLLLWFPKIILAQPYSFTNYQLDDGLSDNSVLRITQDSNGFLWFGTRNGICRYDGYNFKTFFPDNRLQNRVNFINCVVADSLGGLWVGTSNALYYYDAFYGRYSRKLDSLTYIRTLFLDSKQQLWLCSGYKIYCYNPQTQQLQQYITDRKLECYAIQEYKGHIWLGVSDDGLYRLNPQNGQYTSFNIYKDIPQKPDKWITKILPDGHGSLLIATSQGLKTFDLTTLHYKDLLTHHQGNNNLMQIRDVLKASPTKFWISTDYGVYVYNETKKSFTHIVKDNINNYSLSDNSVYGLFMDHERGIWAGTYHGGVNYYNSHGEGRFHKYIPDNTPTSLSGNVIRAICPDKEGNIWIGTEDAGLNKLNPHTGKITQFGANSMLQLPGSLPATNIQGLCVVKDKLWVGTYFHGMYILDIKTGKIIKHYEAGDKKGQFSNDFVISFLYTSSKKLYIGTQYALYTYNADSDDFSLQPVDNRRARLGVVDLLEDSQHKIWVATLSKGLFYLDPLTGRYKQCTMEPGPTDLPTTKQINAVFEDHSHKIWLATNGGGLCYVDQSTNVIKRFNISGAFTDNFITCIQEDNDHNLWISTQQGLLKLDAARKKFIRYTVSDGLPTNQFNANSGYKDKKGNLYFGTYKGLIGFNPTDHYISGFNPPVFVTNFQIGDYALTPGGKYNILHRDISTTDTVTLSYKQSSFNIGFACLSFVSPKATSYDYMLEGLEVHWTHLRANRSVYFTKVPPGKYIFKIKASSKAFSIVSKKQLVIIISPPIWATSWAYFLYGLLTILLIYFILKGYYKRIQQRKEKEIFDAKIEFFTNITHELKTPLTLIKVPIEIISEKVEQGHPLYKNVAMLEKNANRLSDLVDQLMDFRKTEAGGFQLNLNQTNINTLLKECFDSFGRLAAKQGMHYQLSLHPQPVFAEIDKEALRKVFSNLISNAIKYGKTAIQIQLATYPGKIRDKIEITFSNDGPLIPAEFRVKIFEPFFRVPQNTTQKGTGIGLALSKFLTELQAGKLSYQVIEGKNVFILEII